MPMNGLLSGFNEQRASNTNYLAELDSMQRAAIAQALDKERMQNQQQQFAQELAMRQQQSQQSGELERSRMTQQGQQFDRNFNLQNQEFGLKQKSELGKMTRDEQARNALMDLLAQGGDISSADLGKAVLPYDPTTGINLIKAGKDETRQQALLDRTGGTGVSAPQGYRWTKDGNLEAIPGGAADPAVLARMEGIKSAYKTKEQKPLTEVQGNAVGFGMRASEADKIINGLADQGVLTGSLIKQGVESVPLIGGALGTAANALVASPQQQQVEQAQRDFVNALLRKESGASISPAEFDNARKQYFAQPGDAPEVLAQKEANRDTAIRALRIQAGPGGENIPERGQSKTHNSLPDPRQYNGKIARDTSTGTRWMSNGRDWVRAP